MSSAGPSGISRIFNLLVSAYLSLFFITLGSDFLPQTKVRIYFGFLILLIFIVMLIKRQILLKFHWVVALFAGFIGYLFIRAGWATLLLHRGMKPTELLPLVSYSEWPLKWSLCFLFFWISFLIGRNFQQALSRLQWMAWAGFLIAINAVPMLLLNPKVLEEGPLIGRYSHPLFFQPWVVKYLISDFASPNYTGDVIAFGFFPALGMLICTYFYMRRKHLVSDYQIKRPALWLLLYGLFALVGCAAIWLFFSRGTILCFIIALLFYFLFVSFKFSSGLISRFISSFIVIALAFLIWAGNFHRVMEELGTLGGEMDQNKTTSFATNIEGAERAMRISKDYPVWGVGSGNYYKVSEFYATPDTEERLSLANFQAMCFYLQLIAEEGAGAYLFFLFLAGFFIFSIYRLIATRHYFKFIAALSFLMPCLMVFLHASFNYLMQRFSMSMLVFMTMGIAVGILSVKGREETAQAVA